MTTKDIIELLRKHKPITPDEVRKLGIRIKFKGSGAYRQVYIYNNLAFKFIKDDNCDYTNREHAREEINNINKVLSDSEAKHLKKYVPVIYYSDTDGYLTVMKKYKPYRGARGDLKIMKDLSSYFGSDHDFYEQNLAWDGKKMVALDWGIV